MLFRLTDALGAEPTRLVAETAEHQRREVWPIDALESRAKEKRAAGGRAYDYRDGKVDKVEAYIVQEIFGRFVDGASCRAIAAERNARPAAPGYCIGAWICRVR